MHIFFFGNIKQSYILRLRFNLYYIESLLTSWLGQGYVSWDYLVCIVEVSQGHFHKLLSCSNNYKWRGTCQVIFPGAGEPDHWRQPPPWMNNGVRILHQVFYRQPRSWENKREFLKKHVHVGNNWDGWARWSIARKEKGWLIMRKFKALVALCIFVLHSPLA